MAVEVARLNEPTFTGFCKIRTSLNVSVVQLTSRSEPSIEPLAAPEHSYLNAVIKTASLKANQFDTSSGACPQCRAGVPNQRS